jgi:hypothetical protein
MAAAPLSLVSLGARAIARAIMDDARLKSKRSQKD